MNREAARHLARSGELYPAVILHGGTGALRAEVAVDLARTLLCAAPAAERPCGVCRHCRRIVWPQGEGDERFHPDFHVALRDLKTSTSVEAARNLVRPAQISPFEARGQVFVVASAESLTPEAANSLLKTLEEPHTTAPRHFLLLAPSRLDLLATLRSRSLSLWLGPAEPLDPEQVSELGRELGECLAAYADSGAAVYLLAAADILKRGIGGWEDPRAGRPWAAAAAALVRAVEEGRVPASLNARLLGLAAALLGASAMRLRGITPERILEGLLTRHLAGPA